MKELKRINKKVSRVVGVILVIIMLMAVGFKFYASNYYRADMKAISEIEQSVIENVQTIKGDDLIVFAPKNSEPKAIIVFYPGGKVQYTAYSGLMYELADRGYTCLLPRMPENLAFLRVGTADDIKNKYPFEVQKYQNLDWYLAGHSLGGVAATQYLAGQEDGMYKGIILCASYTTSDFSNKDIRLLSIFASEDGVINTQSYEESKTKWPSDSEEYIIHGGIHSFFGNYGIQDGDGVPTISNTEQLIETADAIDGFISRG